MDDLVTPPAGGDLGCEFVHRAFFGVDHVGNVVGERTTGLPDVGEARLEEIISNGHTVGVDVVDAERGRGPDRPRDLLGIPDGRDEEARAVRRPLGGSAPSTLRNRRILHGQPLGSVQRNWMITTFGAWRIVVRKTANDKNNSGGNGQCSLNSHITVAPVGI